MPWSAAEDVRWLDRLLARAPRATAVRGRALLRAADMLRLQGRVAAARGRLEECEAVVRALGGDLDGLDLGHLRLQHAQLAAAEGDVARTRARYDEALARARAGGDPGLLQGALSMGLLALGWGDRRGARLALEEWLSLARAHRNAVGVAGATIRLGIVARLEGDVARAHDLLQAGLGPRRWPAARSTSPSRARPWATWPASRATRRGRGRSTGRCWRRPASTTTTRSARWRSSARP